MSITLHRLALVTFAAVLISCGMNSADAGKTTTKIAMSGEMVMFLLDAGMSDKELDFLMELGVDDDDIMLIYGLTEKDVYGTKGSSGLDLSSSRIKGFGESTGEGPSTF